MRLRLNNGVLLALAVVLPFLVIATLVARYGVNVPVTDQYALVPLFQKFHAGTLGFHDLWQQHNEHRVLFPTIVLLILARLTHWDIWAELTVSLLLALVSAVVLAYFMTTTLQSKRLQPIIVLATSLLFFSPVQWQNWIWGWQLEWFLCVCAALLAFWLLSRAVLQKGFSKAFIGALVFAVIASYSLASGLFIWIIGLLYLILKQSSGRKRLIWGAAGLFTTAFYFYHYINPDRQSPLAAVLQQPVNFVKYFLAFIGRPLTDRPTPAIILGIILMLLFMALSYIAYRKRLVGRYAIWLGLGAYAILAGIATSSSRMDWGIINAMSSRYTAFSNLFLIAVVAMSADVSYRFIYQRITRRPLRHLMIACGCALLSLLVVSSFLNGMSGLRTQSKTFHYIAACSRQSNPTNDCLYQIFFQNLTIAKDCLDTLKAQGYGGYPKDSSVHPAHACAAF